MIHIYFGDGKGKTTAAVGLATRAAGRDFKVLFLQFLKSENSGERKILKSINNITVPQLPQSCKFTFQMTDKEKADAVKQSKNLFQLALSSADKFDMIIMDEVFSATDCGFIDKEELKELMKTFPSDKELVLTGHTVSEDFLVLGDYVSEIKKVRHPFDKGTSARHGIEF